MKITFERKEKLKMTQINELTKRQLNELLVINKSEQLIALNLFKVQKDQRPAHMSLTYLKKERARVLMRLAELERLL